MVLVELLTSLEEGPYVSVAVFPSSGATREVLHSLCECGSCHPTGRLNAGEGQEQVREGA